ncbi:MAG: hypothetical protein ABSC49_00255 [Candidatus Microgenomates bacterium]|jgi:hypothetical protein
MTSISELGRAVGDFGVINEEGAKYLDKEFDIVAEEGNFIQIISPRGFIKDDDKRYTRICVYNGADVDTVVESDKDILKDFEKQIIF